MSWTIASRDSSTGTVNSNQILGIYGLIGEYTKGSNDKDIILVGKYGFIWPYGEGTYMVVIDSPAIGNKYLKLEEKMTKGEEVGLVVDEAAAHLWLQRIKVPNRRNSQLKLMLNKMKR